MKRSTGRIIRFERQNNRFLFEGEHADVMIRFLTPEIFRVKLFFAESADDRTTAAVVSNHFGQVEVAVEETEEQVILTTASLQVVIGKAEFSLQVFNRNGDAVCEGKSLTWDAKGAITCTLGMPADSHFYGLGEKTGLLDKRNERYSMWNTDVYAPHVPEIEELYVSIPFLIHYQYGKATYGIFLDNPGKTFFDMRTSAESYSFGTATGDLDFYVIYGPNLRETITRYTELTGRMSIPPRWAIGYHQSRYSYMNQEEVLELARTFREKQIPCDVIYLDIHYMDEYRVFTWDKTRFPNPKAMLKELKEMGFRIVPIVDPGVKKDPRYPIYQEGIAGDHFCKKLEGDLFTGPVWPGESAFPDFTDANTAKWWGEKHRSYVDAGIQGIWNDMNEPAVFNESKTMDLDVVHRNNELPITHEEIHNLYGMLMSKATYEGLKEIMQLNRPFVLTRAAYAGIQRYAAVWTGDNRSFWEHMAMAMPMVLNLGMSGVPLSGPDIGGFAHHTTGELLARWMQMGAFFPFCRNHSAIDTVRQEPWAFGKDVEDICRTYIGLRYKWMPYFYSLFHEASQTGMPVMRPLILEYQEDRQVYNVSDQFLLGSHILIAPIYRPDTEYRTVYLPRGTWYDYWTGESYEGNQHIMTHAPLERLPIYVKGGAIIPEEPLKQHAEEQATGLLIVNVYAGNGKEQHTFQLYEDDGTTFGYEKGAYNLIRFALRETQKETVFSYDFLHRGYQAGSKQLLLKVSHLPAVSEIKDLQKVALDDLADEVTGFAYDEAAKELVIKINSELERREIRILHG